MTKKYKVGTKLKVIPNGEHPNRKLDINGEILFIPGRILTIGKSTTYLDLYHFKEEEDDEGWKLDYIEDSNYFEEVKTSWRDRIQSI